MRKKGEYDCTIKLCVYNTRKDMKIGTITCHWPYNYGAVLQTYALYKYLQCEGNDVFIIDYVPDYVRKGNKRNLIVRSVRLAVRSIDFSLGKKVFGRFIKNEILLSSEHYSTLNQMVNNPPYADVYIAGSDQIWNCILPNGRDDAFFLTFAPKGSKKISYAASIAAPYIPDSEKNRFKKNLSCFDAISVREKTGVELLEDIDVKNVKQVLDPVYLLNKNDWKSISEKSTTKLPNERYILVYGFERQKNLYDYAKRLAKKRGCKIVSINTYLEDYLLGMDKYYYNATPYDFVKLVENAEEVVTNSFHGISFSVIFNKPFYLFKKAGKENSRMLDLITGLGLESRIVVDENVLNIGDIDWLEVQKKLEIQRNESMEFLEIALKGLK